MIYLILGLTALVIFLASKLFLMSKQREKEALQKEIEPIIQLLERLDQEIRYMDKNRIGESHQLKEQIKQLVSSDELLRKETLNLVKALRKPDIRGMWGEVQLKRVLEAAGMLNHVDFLDQPHHEKEGAHFRPDLIVKLPGERKIIIDAKAPFDAFLEASMSDDDIYEVERLTAHARRLKEHIQMLSKKRYHEKFEQSPEFVILFLPSEVLLSAALKIDPVLIEMGSNLGVVLATPTTLIALLKTVAFAWKEEKFSKNADEIRQLGHELYKRLYDLNNHFGMLGRNLSQSVETFNKMVGSFEKRVLVSARRFQDLGGAPLDLAISEVDAIDKTPRSSNV